MEISIKINIADRIYPLTIKSEEEENIRKAAKLINEQMKDFQQKYEVKDKQDLLSMCALQYATESLNHKGNELFAAAEEKITKIDKLLSVSLSSNSI